MLSGRATCDSNSVTVTPNNEILIPVLSLLELLNYFILDGGDCATIQVDGKNPNDFSKVTELHT